MLKKTFTTALVMALTMSMAAPAWSCTTVIVGKDATDDGSVIVSHSVDGGYDTRLLIVPGGTHEPGTMMPVYSGMAQDDVRGRAKVQIGEIPQAAETYSYLHSGYPFMNEYGLVIGEDTSSGRRDLRNPFGLMYIETLQQLALQRTKTARDAIRLMGAMAEQYGYGDGLETLTISDGVEGWVFDVYGPGPNWAPGDDAPGAVWVAQRVPDDSIYVSANRVRITTLDLSNPDYYMMGTDTDKILAEYGFYNPETDGAFNWAAAVEPKVNVGVYGLARREWRSFTLLIPSLGISPYLSDPMEQYDFSYQADHKVNIREVQALYRDYYQGTEFDLSVGLAAGPFGNPNRGGVNTDQRPAGLLDGAGFERGIGWYTCSYTFVAQVRSWLPDPLKAVSWVGMDDGKSTVFMPIYSGVTELNTRFSNSSRSGFDDYTSWNAFSFVSNWANLRWNAMMDNRIRPMQQAFEDKFFAVQPAVESTALALYEQNPDQAKQYLTDYTNSVIEDTTVKWWDLGRELVYIYAKSNSEMGMTGFPTWWLEQTNYGDYHVFK